jgi:hypothetical protein
VRDSDRSKFIEVLQGVHDFYSRELSVFAGRVWWDACATFDLEQVTKALSAHLMDPERGMFMPKPADLVRELQGTRTDRSLIAWGKVLDAIQRVGAYQSVVFDDGVIHAVIEDLGGWVKVCRGNVDDLSYLQKRFCDSYKAYAARPDVPYPAKLLGDCEQQNAHLSPAQLRGYNPPPMLVGDPVKAQQVLTHGGAAKTAITVGQVLPAVARIGGKAA